MRMTFLDACLYSLTGMLVVFFALVLLMCIIKLMTAVGDAAQKRKTPAANKIPALESDGERFVIRQTGPMAPGTAGEVKLYDTDPRTAAMLMAIVANETQTPLNELRFLSIKEVKE